MYPYFCLMSAQMGWTLCFKLLFSEEDSKRSPAYSVQTLNILTDRVKINRWHWSLGVWQQSEQPFRGWNTPLIIFLSSRAMNTQPNRFQCSEPNTSWLIHRILESSSCLLYLLYNTVCANSLVFHFEVNLVRMTFSSFPRRNDIYFIIFLINERISSSWLSS